MAKILSLFPFLGFSVAKAPEVFSEKTRESGIEVYFVPEDIFSASVSRGFFPISARTEIVQNGSVFIRKGVIGTYLYPYRKDEAFETFTSRECVRTYIFKALGNIYLLQFHAISEDVISYSLHTFGKAYFFKTFTTVKSTVEYIGYPIRQFHVGKSRATAKSFIKYISNVIGNIYFRERRTVLKSIFIYVFKRRRQDNAFQRRASRKYSSLLFLYTDLKSVFGVRLVSLGKFRVLPLAQRNQAVGQNGGNKPRSAKRVRLYFFEAFGKYHLSQRDTTLESSRAYARYFISKFQTGERCASAKRFFFDIGHVIAQIYSF